MQAAQQSDGSRHDNHPPPRDAAEQPTQAARVLIVEDDYLVSLDLESRLRDAGYDVVGISATAEEAIDGAEAARPHLVIMDIRLAGERDGVDAAIEIFERFNIRSVFATAHVNAETKARAHAARPAGWLQKPYSDAALVSAIEAALGRRG